MANQILAGAVFQAGQVIAGVDADNPPYVGPPVPTYLVVRVAEGDKTSGSYPYQDRLYLYDVYNIESDPIVVNNPNGDDADQWNNYSDGFGNPNTVITSGGQQLFIGAPLEDLGMGGYGNQGVVYVYDKSDLTTPVTTMTSPTPSENGHFGRSVATNDTHLFVGEQGNQKLYIYDLSDLSASPTVILDTRPAANSQWNFAAHLHVTNTHLVIGDDNYDTSSASYNHGSVSIYDLSDLSSPIHLTDQDLQGACSWMGLRISNDGSQFYVGVNASWNPNNSAIHYGQMQIRDIATGNLVSTITYPAPNGNYAAFAGYIAETDDKFILSAMLEDVGGDGQQGRVYVYDKSNLSSPSTIITSPLTGDNTYSGSDRFGASLVIDDNYLYVSDRGSAGAGSSYAIYGTPGAYVWRYDLSDLSATPYQITEPAVDRAEHIQQFGTFIHMVQFPFPVTESSSSGSTSSSASWLVVAAPTGYAPDGSKTGEAYVYDATDLSAAPTVIESPNSDQQFAGEVSVSNDKVFVAHREEDNQKGAVYVYDATDLSATPTKITAPDAEEYDQFGRGLSAFGDTVVVGAWRDDEGSSTDVGSLYVYDATDLSAAPTKLTHSNAEVQDYLGRSVAVTENHVIASAYGVDGTGTGPNGNAPNGGAVYVWDKSDLSAAPTKLTLAEEGNVLLGWNVSAHGNTLLASNHSDNNYQGAAWVYDLSDLSVAPTKLTSPSGQPWDFFGAGDDTDGIVVHGDTIVIGAKGDHSNRGAVFVYDATDLSAAPTELINPHNTTHPLFACSVSVFGDMLVVGSERGTLDGNVDADYVGKVYVYDLNDLSSAPTELTPPNETRAIRFGEAVAVG